MKHYDSKLSLRLNELGPETALLDLPNELLLHILINTHPQVLYTLSLVCRRLHAIALPLFLESHGIIDPTSFTRLYVLDWHPSFNAAPDALAGMAMIFPTMSIQHLSCYFQDPRSGIRSPSNNRNTFQPATNLPFAVRRLERFVRGLESIETVALSLVWDPYYVVQTLKGAGAAHVAIPEIQEWASAFSALLNTIMEKGCVHLTVEYDAAIEAPFRFKGMGKVVKKALAFLSQNMLRLDVSRSRMGPSTAPELQWEWERPVHESIQKVPAVDSIETAHLSPSAQINLTLVSLCIHSPVLLLPPFTNWTLSVLHNHTCLTSLSFAYIPFSKDIWRLLLPLISEAVGGRLTELKVLRNCPHLDVVDLLRFLTKLPLLTKLVVDRTFRLRFQAIRPPSALFSSAPLASSNSRSISNPTPHNLPLPFFTDLRTLQAPVEFVSLLLDARPSTANAKDNHFIPLPHLNYLTVYPSSLLIHPPSYVESTLVVNALHRLVQESRRNTEIDTHSTPNLNIEFSLNAEMEFIDFAPVSRYFETLSERQEFQRTVWDAVSGTEVDKLGLGHQPGDSNSTGLGQANMPLIAFIHITHLVLHKFKFMTRDAKEKDMHPAALCAYINLLFPSLQRLSFVSIEATEGNRVERGISEGKDEAVEHVIRIMRRRCPQVKELVVGGEVFMLR